MTKTVKLEAERKFLIRKGLTDAPITIQQRYAPDGRVYRGERTRGKEAKMMIIEKEPMINMVRLETIETYSDRESNKFYDDMLAINNSISKTRDIVAQYDGIDIMVDTYIEMDLAIMEIEHLCDYTGDGSLEEAYHKISTFVLPDFFKAKVIKEVTGDPAFSNRALAEDIIQPTPRFNGKILD